VARIASRAIVCGVVFPTAAKACAILGYPCRRWTDGRAAEGPGLFCARVRRDERADLAQRLRVDPINLYMKLREAGALTRVAAE